MNTLLKICRITTILAMIVIIIFFSAISVQAATEETNLNRTLSVGSSGNDVKILQSLLSRSKDIYPLGLITGYFGRLTSAAVSLLQEQIGLDPVGSVGPLTRSYLNGVLSNGQDMLLAAVVKSQSTLNPPLNVSGGVLSDTSIELTWLDTNKNETGYAIERSINPTSNFLQIAQTIKNAIRYTNSGLTASTTYYYRLRAFKTGTSISYSAYSNVVSVTTGAVIDVTAPMAPINVTAAPIDCSSIQISWSSSLDTGGSGLHGYHVYRNGSLLATIYAPTTSIIDSGLSASTSYSYMVSAFDNAGNQSAQSNSANATTLSCITIPVFKNPTVSVLNPDASETWQKGKTYTIQWHVDAENQPIGPVQTAIYLDVFDTCGSTVQYYKIIAAPLSFVGDNGYQWTVPTNLADAQIYRISIGVQSGASEGFASSIWSQNSKNFTIYTTDPTLAPKSFSLTDANVSVISPNGGEIWQPGKNYTIQWQFLKTPDQFQPPFNTTIFLARAVGEVRENAYTIAKDQLLTTQEGLNQYTWTYPVGAKAINGTSLEGDNFRIGVQVNKLSYYSSPQICKFPFDESNDNIALGNYTPLASTTIKTITIQSPNGGEFLDSSTNSPITFKITGYNPGTPLALLGSLLQNDVFLGHIFPSNGSDSSLNTTSDTITTTWRPGTHYGYSGSTPIKVSGSGFKINLLLYQNGFFVTSDKSDATFTILP